MKRSEMILKLTNKLIDSRLNNDFDMKGPAFCAESLLTFLEELQMLPPPDTRTTYYSSDMPEGYCPNHWEEEEELT